MEVPKKEVACEHNYGYIGLVYEVDPAKRTDTDNRGVFYYHHFHCTKCLGYHYVKHETLLSDTDAMRKGEPPHHGALPK